MSDEFEMLDVIYGGTVIAVRVRWLPGPRGRGAVRVRDDALWETARWCQLCLRLGYDHGDIDAVLEAQRLVVDHATRVAECTRCGALRCDACTCGEEPDA